VVTTGQGLRRLAAALGFTAALLGLASPAPAATASTGTPVLSGVALHDGGAVMQSFARTGATGSWFFAQVMQEGRFGQSHAYHLARGDLTLTHVSADGTRRLSYMYLRGFGHGEAISVQWANPGIYIWIEAVSVQGPTSFPDGFGTKIARFRWAPRATITPYSAGVRLFNPRPGEYRVAPSVDVRHNLITVRWMTAASVTSYSAYRLDAFTAGNFTPLYTIAAPPAPGTGQGWAMIPGGGSADWLTGDHTSSSNPPPGDTLLTTFGAATGQLFLADAPDMHWREPEGLQFLAGQVCNGWATGTSATRLANVWCRAG
jgi:hypothetical protein